MIVIALGLTVIVGAIALLHAYWAAGGLWPGKSQAELSSIVYGIPNAKPAPKLTAQVAAMIAGVAVWPLLLAPLVSRHLAPELAAIGGLAIAATFLLRGFAGFTPWMAKHHSAEPFASYNRKYYSPICFALGTGFLILAFNGGML